MSTCIDAMIKQEYQPGHPEMGCCYWCSHLRIVMPQNKTRCGIGGFGVRETGKCKEFVLRKGFQS